MSPRHIPATLCHGAEESACRNFNLGSPPDQHLLITAAKQLCDG
jgi:hypothetical protein